jgi:hypothetical protein
MIETQVDYVQVLEEVARSGRGGAESGLAVARRRLQTRRQRRLDAVEPDDPDHDELLLARGCG